MRKTAYIALLLFNFCAAIPANAQTKTGIHLLHTDKIYSDGGWDYLLADHASQKLYVSHGTQVNILNEKTGDSVGVITNTVGVHGILIMHDLKKGYTSNGKTGDLSVFNISTNAVIKRIKTGDNPDAIFYDEFSKKIYVCNGHSLNISVIDPVTDQVIINIPLGGKPETAVSDGKGKIFVNLEDKSEVLSIDAKSFKVLQRFKLEGGEEPAGLAIDRVTSRLFVGCANKLLLVLDAQTGKKITSLPIGDGSDGVAFDPELKLVYSSNGDGTLTVIKEISANKFTVAENIKTAQGARTLTLDYTTHHIFMPTSDFKTAEIEGKKAIRIPGTFRVLEYGK